jgi:hypothetical protein
VSTLSSNASIQRLTVRFLAVTALLLIAAVSIDLLLIRVLGAPVPESYTLCPTAFFVSSFFLIATGASLGFALSTAEPRLFRIRLNYPFFFGALFLGIHSYGLWCLLAQEDTSEGGFKMIALALGWAHLMCCVMVLLLVNFAVARMKSGFDDRENHLLLKVATFFWAGLGLCWTALLCSFAALL